MTAVPDEFASLLSLVNSFDIEANKEELPDVAACLAWFEAHGLWLDDSFGEQDVAAVHRFREGVRVMWRAHNASGPLSANVYADINALLSGVSFHWSVDRAGVLIPAVSHRGYLAQLVTLLVSASGKPNWHRLKVCQNQLCEWAFYDQSRNQSHRWCSMTACGSRQKARRYRERQRQRGE